MLFDYTYLLKEFNADFFNTQGDQTYEFVIPIDDRIAGKKPELFKQLLNSKNRFCFYIPVGLTQQDHKYIKEEILQNIVRLLFLPNYLRVNGKHVFFLENTEVKNKNLELLKNEFYSELKKQGFSDIIIEGLRITTATEKQPGEGAISLVNYELNSYLASDNADECFATFTKKFVLPACFYKKWIVPVGHPADFLNKTRLIEKFENWLALANPLNAQLIKLYRQANRNGDQLESENRILKFKLESNTYSLKLMREESIGFVDEVANLRNEVDRLANQINNPEDFARKVQPVDSSDNEEMMMQMRAQIETEHNRGNAILAWYKKEYEILPAWYKKFGHLIKVFMGKRTFKSLFK